MSSGGGDFPTRIFCIFLSHIGQGFGFSVQFASILKEFISCFAASGLSRSNSSSPASSQIPPQSTQWSISTSASSSVIIAFLQTGQSIVLSAPSFLQRLYSC